MTSPKDIKKGEREMGFFVAFANVMNWKIDVATLQNGDAIRSEPDIFATVNGEKLAFELSEICDGQIAHDTRKRREPGIYDGLFIAGDVDLRPRVLTKCAKNYVTQCPIELLLYWDLDQPASAKLDDLGIGEVEDALKEAPIVPFRQVWYWGIDKTRDHPVAIEI